MSTKKLKKYVPCFCPKISQKLVFDKNSEYFYTQVIVFCGDGRLSVVAIRVQGQLKKKTEYKLKIRFSTRPISRLSSKLRSEVLRK